jgi:hypothetical protein
MCPNRDKKETICPGVPESPHPKPSPCKFVRSYLDAEGNKVFVDTGLWNYGEHFMSFRRKPKAGAGMHRVKTKFLPERESFDEAQEDLNEYAEQKGWKKINA